MPRKRTKAKPETLQLQAAVPLDVAREIAQLTQQQLADAAGVSKAYICLLETGKRDIRELGLEVASRIALALHVRVARLWPLVDFDGKRIEPHEGNGGRA